ncbi:MAG: hypothetical protein FWE62_00730 [Firmicutes bacterium]|nr:hypothetical protein [Bacillota bacterium]
MKRKWTVVLLAVVMAVSAGLMSACKSGGGTIPDTDQSLQVWAFNGGYGTAWITKALQAFAERPEVKAKYPDFQWELDATGVESVGFNKIEAPKTNYYDLMSMAPEPVVKNFEQYVEPIDDVYDGAIGFGETGLFKNKVIDSVWDPLKFYPKNSNTAKRYFMPGSSSYCGIVYNKELLDALYGAGVIDAAVPRTTGELIKICKDVKAYSGSLYNMKTATVNTNFSVMAGKIDYWRYVYPVWWAQYDGAENFNNYLNAVVEEDGGYQYSPKIFEMPGRLESIKVEEELLWLDHGYVNPFAQSDEFMTAQNKFLDGKGLFMVIGDWYEYEMRILQAEREAAGKHTYDMRFMRLPVVSSLADKLGLAGGDAGLAEIVDAVDAGETGLPGVDTDDFAAVKAARGLYYNQPEGWFIPNYANGKGVAKDFLRFLATDAANAIYAANTYGSRMPFHYDLKTKASGVYNALSPLGKSHNDLIGDSAGLTYLPLHVCYKAVYYGGLSIDFPHATQDGRMGNFLAMKKSAQSLFDDEITWWNTGTRWSEFLLRADLK